MNPKRAIVAIMLLSQPIWLMRGQEKAIPHSAMSHQMSQDDGSTNEMKGMDMSQHGQWCRGFCGRTSFSSCVLITERQRK